MSSHTSHDLKPSGDLISRVIYYFTSPPRPQTTAICGAAELAPLGVTLRSLPAAPLTHHIQSEALQRRRGHMMTRLQRDRPYERTDFRGVPGMRAVLV